MRIVLIASDQTRDRHRVELSARGVQILTESSDRANALMLLPVLKPEVVLLEVGTDLASVLPWVEQAAGLAPGAAICMMGPLLESQDLIAIMRSGVREYLPDPTTAQILEAIGRVKPAKAAPAQPEAPKTGDAGKIAVVYSPKGGVGKSTLAANLAVALHQVTGQRTHLVDLGLQFGDLDLLLNLQPHKTLADLVPVMHDLDARILDQILTPTPIGVRLLSAPVAIEDGEGVTGDHLERAFEAFKAQRGWTVVDCASHLDEVSMRAIELADEVLVPMTFDLATIRRVSRVFTAWEQLGVDVGKVKLVAWAQRGEIAASDVARTLNRPVSYQLPWDPEGVAAAVNQGIPLQIGQPTAPLAVAIRNVAAELSGHALQEKTKEGAGLTGILSSAFSWLKRGKDKDIKLLTAGSGSS